MFHILSWNLKNGNILRHDGDYDDFWIKILSLIPILFYYTSYKFIHMYIHDYLDFTCEYRILCSLRAPYYLKLDKRMSINPRWVWEDVRISGGNLSDKCEYVMVSKVWTFRHTAATDDLFVLCRLSTVMVSAAFAPCEWLFEMIAGWLSKHFVRERSSTN